MSKVKSRNKAAMLIVLIFLLAAGVLYHIHDNNRFVIVEQNIIIDGLPEEFNGYRILQFSDLHGKNFGEKQSNLLAAINSLDYDGILLTGDMNKFEESDLSSSQAVFDLLNGLSLN